MGSFLIRHCQDLLARAARANERRFLRKAKRAMNACSCSAASGNEPRDAHASRAEHLEYITLFAQAGYFNMGYPTDIFHPPLE
jgi:hypothetical protein